MNAVLVFTDNGVVRATYAGREYIQLYLGGGDSPDEVINVFDYRRGEPAIENTPHAVMAAVVAWLAEQEPTVTVSGAWLLTSAGQAPGISWSCDGDNLGLRLWASR